MLSLRAKILLFYILLQKYNNISKHARKSGKSFRKSYQEILGEAGIIYWLASELKFKVTLLYVAQLLQLLSLMSLQFLHPFCQLERRALTIVSFTCTISLQIKIRIFLKLLPLQGVGLYFINTQGVALGQELLPLQGVWGKPKGCSRNIHYA